MLEDNCQNNTHKYKRAEYIIPQLDGTYNSSDGSDLDSHSLSRLGKDRDYKAKH